MQEDVLVDNTGLPQASEEIAVSSEQLSEFSTAPVADIPEAVREDAEAKSQSIWTSKRIWWGLGGLGTVALLGLPLVMWQFNTTARSPEPELVSGSSQVSTTGEAPQSAQSNPQSSDESALSDSLLGHLPYDEAPESELEPVSDDGTITLRRAAAEKFLDMVEAARADGINLVPLSGFRSIEEQETVFFDVKAERGQRTTTRAEVSAPPGYSEHHTGYAIDIGDSYYPDADLRESFEKTPAFEWLQENAGYYSFELSFPRNNPQGVSYEPWHWRFVGDRHSLETFYQVRSGQTSSSSSSPANRLEESEDLEDAEDSSVQ